MACRDIRVPPKYIVLFKGDSSNFSGNQEIVIRLDTEMSLAHYKATFRFFDFEYQFEEIPESKELVLVFPNIKTREFPIGAANATLVLQDPLGRTRTLSNRINIVVTNSVEEAYCNDDQQAISVVVTGQNYVKSVNGVRPGIDGDVSVPEFHPFSDSDVFDMNCNDWDFRQTLARLWKACGGSTINEG